MSVRIAAASSAEFAAARSSTVRNGSVLALIVSSVLSNYASAHADELHLAQAGSSTSSLNTEKQTRELSIPAGSLAEALEQLARQTGADLVYRPDQVAGLTTAGVTGEVTIEVAITRLLEGTALKVSTSAAGAYLISVPKATASTAASAEQVGGGSNIHLASANGAVNASAEPRSLTSLRDAGQNRRGAGSETTGAQATTVEEIVVQGVRFYGEEATTAMKLPMSIKDTPQTVMAITRDMMDFAAIKTFQDVYKVDATGGTTHRLDNFTVNYYRGFRQQSNNAIKIDGFRLLADTNLDFAPFERLEVVKGATSTMYGQNSIAGTLNIISKMPQPQFGGEFKAEAGSFDHYRIEADLYGPVAGSDALTYRLVAAGLDANAFMDHVGRRTKVFAPTLQYDFSDRTRVFARLNYQKLDITAAPAAGMQYLGDLDVAAEEGYDPALLRIPQLPRSFFSGQDWGTNQEREVKLIHAGLDHRFENDWTLRVNAQHNRQTLEYYNWLQHVGVIRADGVPDFSIIGLFKDVDWQLQAGEVNLYGDIEAFGQRHTLFIGADYAESTDAKGPRLLAIALPGEVPSLFDPNYNHSIAQPASLEDYVTYNRYGSSAEYSGVSGQALLRPVDGLTVLVASRYSRTRTRSRFQRTDGPVEYDGESGSKVTYQGGVTYELTPQLNVYLSYGETYEPQSGLIAPGQPIEPQEGRLKEIGLKGEIPGRFAYSIAVFDMQRSNISQSNPMNPGFVVPLGTQRSRGVEIAAQGTVLPGWEVYGSLGVMDAQYIAGDYKGYQAENAPKFGLSVFTSYELQGGPLRGVGFGAGVVNKRGRETFFTQFASTGRRLEYDFGNYTEVDLRVFRNFEHWRFQLSATNVLNEKYYTPIENDITVGMYVNPGRSFIGQMAYRF